MTGYGERLAAIRASATDAGVSVVVDLHGALVDLRFERRALTRSPRALAELIRRLAGDAGADALQQGQEVLGDLLPAELPGGSARQPDSFVPATWAT
ncbi:YbaB/EbfC family nucleoid-associated protein [Amycolatopsis sp. NPDC049688]|uniref:YbaB/EbfC family nucleoid-associated protein n=1 Tax=Amycolatopsis sp. NPDC049688 TaxID=3154733 RepID=UPI00341C9227